MDTVTEPGPAKAGDEHRDALELSNKRSQSTRWHPLERVTAFERSIWSLSEISAIRFSERSSEAHNTKLQVVSQDDHDLKVHKDKQTILFQTPMVVCNPSVLTSSKA